MAMALLTGVHAPGQGTLNLAPVPVTNGLTGELAGTGFVSGLYYGPTGAAEGSLVLATSVPLLNGYADFGSRVTGTGWAGGTTLELQVRAWEATFATYDAAMASGLSSVLAGKSIILQAVTGGPLPPVPDPLVFPGFTIWPVPEPSSLGLALLGMATLRWRRKGAGR